MANRNKGRRGRSRKSRPRTAAGTATDAPVGDTPAQGEAPPGEAARQRKAQRSSTQREKRARAREREPRERRSRGFKDPLSVGERPQAPWHPLPLSELLILVGAIGTVVGLSKGISNGGPPLLAGLAAVVIGTVEVTLREHLSGYRSHTFMLALIPPIVLHSALVLIFFVHSPQWVNVALLALDLAVFAVAFKLLRARFLDARRELVSRGRR